MALFDFITNDDLNSQISDLISKRPKYNISQQYGDNQGLAKANAFGRDRSSMIQESNIEQDAANATAQGKDVASSSSGLLNMLSQITSNKNNALRGVASDEAAIQQQKLGQVFATNKDMAEEQDKAWDYNVNQPYQNKIQDLRLRRKNRSEMLGKILDTAGSFGISALTGGFGKGGQQQVDTGGI